MFSAIRTAAAPAARCFSTTPAARKTVTDTVKETLEPLNKAAGSTLLKGIEVGEKASAAVKDAAEPVAAAAKNITQDASRETQKKGAGLEAAANNKLATDPLEVSGRTVVRDVLWI
ncbi:hypothetical protein JCM8547_002098 [Rhodosporidiobolus lusitaniae]